MVGKDCQERVEDARRALVEHVEELGIEVEPRPEVPRPAGSSSGSANCVTRLRRPTGSIGRLRRRRATRAMRVPWRRPWGTWRSGWRTCSGSGW